MSQYGSPPDPTQPDSTQPGAGSAHPEPYSPYPDNWNAAPSGSPGQPSPYGQADPYAAANPYGQQSPYAAPGQPGSPVNPYAGPGNTKPTFGFGGYAGWFTRVGAALVDQIFGLVAGAPLWIGYVILISNTTTTTNPDGTTTTDYSGSAAVPLFLIVIGALTSLAFYVWNICIRQGRTGATVGKSVLAVRLVNSDLQPIGAGWSFLRSVLHIVDSICYLGYLWPIWDSRKQTFADKIMNTFVIHATTQEPRVY
jgi:uncharacterized RDD family membrane protein YckC